MSSVSCSVLRCPLSRDSDNPDNVRPPKQGAVAFLAGGDDTSCHARHFSSPDSAAGVGRAARSRGVRASAGCAGGRQGGARSRRFWAGARVSRAAQFSDLQTPGRSEEHTSELQSRSDLVCRLLLEKKKETQ